MCCFGHVQRMEENRIVCVGFGHVQRMEGNRIVSVGLDVYREWKRTELCVLFWTCTENARKYNCVCWFGQVQRMEDNRNVCVGWTCTENGRK